MRKRKWIMKSCIIVLTILALTGCKSKEDEKESIQQTNQIKELQEEETAEKGAKEEETEKGLENENKNKNKSEADSMKEKSYHLFVTAPSAWVGDVMPMTDDKGIQIYYLYETDNNGVGFHPIYKFSTTNLYEYQNDGLMIPFAQTVEEPDLAIGTGSVLYAQGQYHCFYTGHNYLYPEQGKDKECVMHAVSDDNVIWTKIPEDTFLAPDNYDGDNFRDPFVFWNEEDQCYWLLIAAREDGYGITARYTSADLSNWELQEPIFTPKNQFMLECPDLFQLGDKYYLFYSWDCVTYYAVSDSMKGPFAALEDNRLDGKAFYAAKSTEYKGKRYLFGWIGRKEEEKDTNGYGWAGNLCVYEINQDENGRLTAKMPDQYFKYFKNEAALPKAAAIGTASIDNTTAVLEGTKEEIAGIDFGTLPETCLLTGKVTFHSENGKAGFAFGNTGVFENSFGILLDGEKNMLRYDNSILSRIRYSEPNVFSKMTFKTGTLYDFKLVVEHEIIVLYVDEKKVLSNRIYRAPGNGFGLFSAEGKVTFSDIKLYIP